MIIEQDQITLSPETKVWRYIDFEKFLILLNTSALHFCRMDKLGDKYEGKIPHEIIEINKTESFFRDIEQFSNSVHRQTNQLRVNCWHMAEEESVAMWKIYCSNNLGIAIQTSLNRLIKSFENGAERLHLRHVNYSGFDKEFFNHANILYPATNKLPSYSFERELRIIFYGLDTDAHRSTRTIPTENGDLIKIKLKYLLENVYLSPNVPEGFDSVIELLKEKFKLNFAIHNSIIKDTSVH